MDMNIDDLQAQVNALQLEDYDEIYNVRMPDPDCDHCGGFGIKAWEDQDSVLCECILSTDPDRQLMKFGVLMGLYNIKKDEV